MTRYAIRHADGRWLALIREDNHVVARWLQKLDHASTWRSMREATLAALDPEQRALLPLDSWTVVTLPPLNVHAKAQKPPKAATPPAAKAARNRRGAPAPPRFSRSAESKEQ